MTASKIGHHNLIKVSLIHFEQGLLKGFQVSTDTVLNELFHEAETASSNQMELELFERYNQLRKERSKIFDLLKHITKRMPDELTEYIKVAEDVAQLSLVEEEELEITLALTQLESMLTTKFLEYLFALEKRIKVLFASRNVTKTNMPFGATSTCWILSQLLDKSNLDLKTKTSLIKNLKGGLVENFRIAYQKIDEEFVKAKILPNIKLKTKLNPEDSKNTKKKAKKDQTSHSNEEFDKGVKAMQDTLSGKPRLTAEQKQNNQYNSKTSKLVNSIFEMMNKDAEEEIPDSPEGNASSSLINNKMMDRSLNQLSNVTNVAAGASEIEKLKEMILDDVRNETGIFYPKLSQRQQNSMDVMGMFYEHVKKDEAIDKNMISSLNAINIPLIRTAIADEEFFDKDSHPARQYLEKLIFASQKWHGTPVVKKLHEFSSNVATEFDGTPKSFASGNEDVESYLRLTERRAKNAEEKWVNAAKGKEKLENSRKEVNEIIEEHAGLAQHDFVKDVIRYVTQDALTLTLLRHGKDSKDWQDQVKHCQNLAKMANDNEIDSLTPKDKIESLHHLSQTMAELGFSKKDKENTLNNIKECVQSAQDGKLEENNSQLELKKVSSISKAEKQVKQQEEEKTIEEIRELTHEERMELTKFKLLPYGTLFDFIINQQRDKTRKRLSWFSPLSNNALFVSLLGNKPLEKTLDSVAIDLHRKNIMVVKVEDKKYFNKALTSIFKKLKSIVN